MTAYDHARAWLDKQSPAVSGAGGHDQAYHVITTLAQGFCLSRGDLDSLAAEYNRRCDPPWTDQELAHKVTDALRAPADKPQGYLLRGGNHKPQSALNRMPPALKRAERREIKTEGVNLPGAMQDGTRALVKAAFAEGEGIRIAPATLNEESREIPDGAGVCLSREEWLRKLDTVKGNPNGIFSSSKRTGIYVSINPMRLGGSKDDDVTAYRHALIEFDNISPAEQWAIYTQSGLPCTAIINSGGKSIHAWVRVDAKDRREYKERVELLYQHFADSGYAVDGKNQNPSRFSRLPNCVRFDRRQELLALGVGAVSWSEWIKEQANADLGPCLHFAELMECKTYADPNCVIGFDGPSTRRYLCTGKSAWLIGPSGIGKSSLLAQFAVGWARGLPVFGIRPRQALKSLIVQAENDKYDLAEMVQGIAAAHTLDKEAFDWPEINERVAFKTETTCLGAEFCDRLHRLIDRERPDIVWVDPLLSFAGIKISEQDQASYFLRQLLQPVLEATGVVLIGIHHTGKPKFAKDVATWTALDFAYSGIGSSELVNWARAVMVLHPHGQGRFELKLAKRGARAGATHPDPDHTPAYDTIWIEHAGKGILWNQIMPPIPAEPAQRPDKPAKAKPQPPAEALFQVLTSGPSPTEWEKLCREMPSEGESARALGRRLAARAVSLDLEGAGDQVCRKKIIPLLKKKKLLGYDEKTELYTHTHKRQ